MQNAPTPGLGVELPSCVAFPPRIIWQRHLTACFFFMPSNFFSSRPLPSQLSPSPTSFLVRCCVGIVSTRPHHLLVSYNFLRHPANCGVQSRHPNSPLKVDRSLSGTAGGLQALQAFLDAQSLKFLALAWWWGSWPI